MNLRPHGPSARLIPALLLLGSAVGCGGAETGPQDSTQGDGTPTPSSAEIDTALQSRPWRGLEELPLAEDRVCAECHQDIVHQWKLHGMADTLGLLEPERQAPAPDPRWLQNHLTGYGYRVQEGAQADGSADSPTWSLEAFRDPPAPGWPGYAQQRDIEFRIGAGIAATSLVMQQAQRWFFAPIEFYTGHGWEPAPQELSQPAGHLDHAIIGECLSCHSDTPAPDTYPLHALGDFRPEPLGCATCHGSGQEHVALMRAQGPQPKDLRILYPGDWEPALQVDLCARCHLEGDAMIDFTLGMPHPAPGERLAEHRAVFVAEEAMEDFRFVSQVQRLAMSACFQESPEMTCTTCHDPHLPPRMQDLATRNRACMDCHADMAPQHDRGADCVACHMPRRQPFDLPHVRISDHAIGVFEDPEDSAAIPFRAVESPEGQWKLFTQRALEELAFSERERDALRAMALMEKGHVARAMILFDTLPTAGSLAATQPAVDEQERKVLRLPQLHFLRGRCLTASNRQEEAIHAYRDALLLKPDLAEAGINLAWLLREVARTTVDTVEGRAAAEEAAHEATRIAELYPLAEAPYNVLFSLAMDRGNQEQALEHARDSLLRFPDQPALLQAIGRIHATEGRLEDAQRYLIEAFRHDPDLPGLPEDIAQVAARLK